MKLSSLMVFSAIVLTSINSAHAVHMYASYECKSDKLELKYDGPGSNYAVGGYSHFYKNNQSLLAIQEEGESEELVKSDNFEGEVIGDETLQVVFDFEKTINNRKLKTEGPKAGQKCEPEEFDYVTTTSRSTSDIRIVNISSDAAQSLGLKQGDKIRMNCNHSVSMPVRCPKKGVWSKKDLE